MSLQDYPSEYLYPDGPDYCPACGSPSCPGTECDLNVCDTCGGGLDWNDTTTCMPCRYEKATGRSYEADVDEAQARGMTFAAHARQFAPTPDHQPATRAEG